MKLVNADELKKRLRLERDLIDYLFDEDKYNRGWQRKDEIVRIMQIVSNMEIEKDELVQVTLCKNCVFFDSEKRVCINRFGNVVTNEDGFCHHARRKEERA